MNNKNVLVHGYFKNYKDMRVLKANLDKLGYENILVDLPLTFRALNYSGSVFAEKMSGIVADLKAGERLNLIGHSTGGLLIRHFLSTAPDISFVNKCILIATPNRGSELADIAGRLSGMSVRLFKTLGSLQTKEVMHMQLKSSFESIDIGGIAGNKCDLVLGRILSGENDGRVTVRSAKLEGLKDFVVLPYDHKEIHYKLLTARLIDSFLKRSRFEIN